MKVLIGHYHLNPGGVTKIIQSQINGLVGLNADIEIEVVCDGNGLENIRLPENAQFAVNPLLGYLPRYDSKASLLAIVEEIITFFMQKVDKTDIIHFHNIGLGKNVAVTYALFLLAKEGYGVINHAHDFPEDRPVNMQYLIKGLKDLGFAHANDVLYPNIPNYSFGVLNRFDKNRLLSLHIPEDRIELWPNPVAKPKIKSTLTKAEAKAEVCNTLGLDLNKKLIAYPVRVIQRKNIGEYILLASVFEDVANFIVTLPPLNPVEIKVYDQWVAFCRNENVPITFEAGLKADFESVMKGADVCFTTSIMEGFGMVFVEPWLWGTPVAGRNIPAVLPDLKALGISYPLIYDALWVKHKGEFVDFPELSMKEQMNAIKSLKNKQNDLFYAQNPTLFTFFTKKDIQFVNNNEQIIANDLSERKYGERLYKLYQAIS